jgi:hypothetical protein
MVPVTNLTSISINGTPQVGVQLTTTLLPNGATVNYQWWENTAKIGFYNKLSGATGSTYTPVAGDQGQWLNVVATGTGSYTGSWVACTQPVGPVEAAPTISVGAQNGTLISGVAGTATFAVTTTNISDDNAVTINWCDSGGNSASQPIGLSASGTNVASNASTITVTATTSAAGGTYYFKAESDTATSSIVAVTVSPAVTQTPLTGIGATTGTTQVGDNLTAGAVTPSGATANYQWQECTTSSGTYAPISNATASTYTLTSTDLNMYLEVVAAGTNGYTGSETSLPVGPVTAASTPSGGAAGYEHHRLGPGCPGVRRDNLTGQRGFGQHPRERLERQPGSNCERAERIDSSVAAGG